jgi:hypothetical protein
MIVSLIMEILIMALIFLVTALIATTVVLLVLGCVVYLRLRPWIRLCLRVRNSLIGK